MLSKRIGRALFIDIAPEQRVAYAATELLVDGEEVGLPASERFVEIDKEGVRALATCADFGAEVGAASRFPGYSSCKHACGGVVFSWTYRLAWVAIRHCLLYHEAGAFLQSPSAVGCSAPGNIH